MNKELGSWQPMKKSAGKLVTLSKWLFTKQPTSAAIDITQRCNLKCLHCYWWKQEHLPEMNDSEMISFMESLKSKGLRVAILYGGEPTLRPQICREADRIFDSILAFTNGTKGYPHLINGQWILSLDGPREINDQMRGTGVYDEAVSRLKFASRPPIVHMTVSRMNRDWIREFVEEMIRLPIKGIGFSFYTPEKGCEELEFCLSLKERDRTVMDILELRKRYGIRIGFTRAMVRQLLSTGDYSKWNRFESCPVTTRVACFKSDGSPKSCTYGDNADCTRCGCAAVVAYRGAFKPLNLSTLMVVLGLTFPGFGTGLFTGRVRPQFSPVRTAE